MPHPLVPESLARKKRFSLASWTPLLSAALFLQVNDNNGGGAAVAGSACAGIGCFGAVVVMVGVLVVNVLILMWVKKDAEARGMENPLLWVIIVLFTGLIGLIIYLLVRPKGEMAVCASCGKKRMQGLAKCPSCGNP